MIKLLTLYEKRSSLWRIPLVNVKKFRSNIVDLLTFTKEIYHGKLHFLYSDPTLKTQKYNVLDTFVRSLTLSWRRPSSYRNQSINLLRKSVDWFLYDNGLYHERVKVKFIISVCLKLTSDLIVNHEDVISY